MLNRNLLSLFFLTIFTVCIYGSQAYAAIDRCPRHIVKTDLKAKRDKTRFMSGSLKGINNYLNSHNVLAFVQNPLSIKTYYNFSVEKLGGGRYCVVLDKVEAQYRSSPRIVMPTDLKRDSCEYKIIRKHEQRHLDVHYKYYDKSVKKYDVFLGRIARNVPIFKPVKTSKEIEAIKQKIMKHFDSNFYQKVGTSIGEMRRLQRKIDSAQEYTFTNRKINRCSKLEKRAKKPNKKSFYD